MSEPDMEKAYVDHTEQLHPREVVKTHEFVQSSVMQGCATCGKGFGALEHNTTQPEWTRHEAVNHPAHYGGDTTYEAIKVIEAWQLGFRLGNVLKYIKRAQHKDNLLQNLQKARWYLDREIAAVEASTRTSHPDPQHASIQIKEEEYPNLPSGPL
jgi:hypothetical protein